MTELQERIRELSASRNRIWTAWGILVVALVLSNLMWWLVPPRGVFEVVQARKVVIVDGDGLERAVLGVSRANNLIDVDHPSLAILGKEVDSEDPLESTSTYVVPNGIYITPGRIEEYETDILTASHTAGLAMVSPWYGLALNSTAGTGSATIPFPAGKQFTFFIRDAEQRVLKLSPLASSLGVEASRKAEIRLDDGSVRLVLYADAPVRDQTLQLVTGKARAELTVDRGGTLRLVCYDEKGEMVFKAP